MYYYSFPDRATFMSLCDTLGWVSGGKSDDDLQWIPGDTLVAYTHDRAIDEIGPMIETPGVYDEDGTELVPPLINDNHHVNYKGEPPAEWEPYRIEVNTPYRVWS